MAARLAIANEARLLQHAQMFRDDRLRDAGPRGQRSHGLFALAAEPLEQGPAGRVGKGAKEQILGTLALELMSRWLWIVI